jgi:pyridine nucleotide-disulfide oxidoreductase family protein
VKRVLLIGAGHAHLVVLRELARSPLYGARVTLVTPHARQIYSGMLPGLIAGHYRLEEVQVDVAQLCARAYVEFMPGCIAALDLDRRRASLEDGTEFGYDLASLSAGSLTDTSLAGAAHAVAVKPFEAFVEGLKKVTLARVAVAGAGAAGTELAMALGYRGAAVTLYSDKPTMSAALAKRAARALRRTAVDFRRGMAVTAIEPGPVVFAGSSHQEFDLVVLATGAVSLPWLRGCGLAVDDKGFVLVKGTLQSVSHPEVFAAGDCAALADAPDPKSGVYAVRHGTVLARNLRNAVAAGVLNSYEPQKRALLLLSCGRRYAIAERGGWSAEGRWAWRWKDWIDRRWISSLRTPENAVDF